MDLDTIALHIRRFFLYNTIGFALKVLIDTYLLY